MSNLAASGWGRARSAEGREAVGGSVEDARDRGAVVAAAEEGLEGEEDAGLERTVGFDEGGCGCIVVVWCCVVLLICAFECLCVV